jgi:pimeloyl-ACP methyl ester carboxylesterase
VVTGVVAALVGAGRRVIAYDSRGHGASDKPHDPAAYADDAMAKDARALLDQLAIERVDIVGYSMGSIVSTRLVPDEPRTRSLVLGGIGKRIRGRRGLSDEQRIAIAEALETDEPARITNASARAFRVFADRTGADRLALAAIQRAPTPDAPTRLADIAVPTMVIVGDADTLAGSPQALADRIPGAVARVVHGDHLGAVGDPAFRAAIAEFVSNA